MFVRYYVELPLPAAQVEQTPLGARLGRRVAVRVGEAICASPAGGAVRR